MSDPSSPSPRTQNNILLIKELQEGPFAEELLKGYKLDIECTKNLESLIMHERFQYPNRIKKYYASKEETEFNHQIRRTIEELIKVKNYYSNTLIQALYTIQKLEQNLDSQTTLNEVQAEVIGYKDEIIESLKEELAALTDQIEEITKQKESEALSPRETETALESKRRVSKIIHPLPWQHLTKKDIPVLFSSNPSTVPQSQKTSPQKSRSSSRKQRRTQNNRSNSETMVTVESRRSSHQPTRNITERSSAVLESIQLLNTDIALQLQFETKESIRPTTENIAVNNNEDVFLIDEGEGESQTKNTHEPEENRIKPISSEELAAQCEKSSQQNPNNSLSTSPYKPDGGYTILQKAQENNAYLTTEEAQGVRVSDILASRCQTNSDDPLVLRKNLIKFCETKKASPVKKKSPKVEEPLSPIVTHPKANRRSSSVISGFEEASFHAQSTIKHLLSHTQSKEIASKFSSGRSSVTASTFNETRQLNELENHLADKEKRKEALRVNIEKLSRAYETENSRVNTLGEAVPSSRREHRREKSANLGGRRSVSSKKDFDKIEIVYKKKMTKARVWTPLLSKNLNK